MFVNSSIYISPPPRKFEPELVWMTRKHVALSPRSAATWSNLKKINTTYIDRTAMYIVAESISGIYLATLTGP